MHKIKVYMGIPSTGERSDAQVYFLRRMEKQYADQIEFVYPDIYVGRIFHDFARNEYIKQFMATDCDMIWFLDSDIVPSERVLELVVNHGDKWKLAGAPYPVFMAQPGREGAQLTYCVYRKGEGKGMYPTAIPESGQDFVDGIATGCIFIKREVIEKLSQPYFEFKYNPVTREMTEGEDLGFCIKVSELGYQFFIDYSMVCHHFKKVSLLDVSNYIEQQKLQIIEACDREIRQIIAKKRLEKLNTTPKKSRIL